MMMTETTKVTRRGFNSRVYPRPAAVRAEANSLLERLLATYERPEAAVITLRPTAYTGPDALLGWMVEIWISSRDNCLSRLASDHFLEIIYE